MIMADKIIEQRKKCGWSQEELAQKLNVSRQAVSKWESAQSTPDLGRILEMARLFGVSTDYLLKDEVGESEPVVDDDAQPHTIRVSMEEATAFMRAKAETAGRVAAATLLCILSPVCLLVLGAAAESRMLPISENFAGGAGLVVLFLMVACAVAMFISSGVQTQRFEYLEKEAFETEYGVTGMVRERQEQYRETYKKYMILGTSLCILSVVPLFAALAVTENEFVMVLMVAALLALVGAGVFTFISAGTRWSSMQTLLQEGDYTRRKKNSPVTGAIKTVYWLIAVAIYLGYSFATDDWKSSWIVWPVAGVLFAAVAVLCNAIEKKDN